ncbi:hypothetical protein GN956_G25659 [Arapaima gigas]
MGAVVVGGGHLLSVISAGRPGLRRTVGSFRAADHVTPGQRGVHVALTGLACHAGSHNSYSCCRVTFSQQPPAWFPQHRPQPFVISPVQFQQTESRWSSSTRLLTSRVSRGRRREENGWTLGRRCGGLSSNGGLRAAPRCQEGSGSRVWFVLTDTL